MLLNDFLDGVGTAERSDDAAFLKRIGLCFHAVLYGFGLARRYRPLRHIPPVIILGEIDIHVQRIACLLLKHKLTVGRAGSPVHHTVCLIGGVVEILHADLLCDHAHERRILFLADFAGERHH